MAKQVEAKLHEESKFWRASKPLPNQSSMQGRESEKESSIQQFRNPLQNFLKPCETKDEENQFHTLCEILQALRNFPV